MRKILSTVLILGGLYYSHSAIKIQEIRTASNNVLVVFLRATTSSVVINDTITNWAINSIAPTKINHYSMQADKSDHHVYLETATLIEGTEYAIKTPYGDTTITFSDHNTFCESIKTNQAAYSALSKSNYANFQIWLGDGGGISISGALPQYEVFEQYTNKVIAEGTLTDMGKSVSAGGNVYKIDLSTIPEGGPYKIAVKGYGCSYPFGVGGVFSKRLAYTIFRGQYYQRCGCPLIGDYGMNVRQKPCHTTIYDTDGPIGEANIVVVGTEPTLKCFGGYHDAGDADRRAYHMANPALNLMIYEAFPDLFFDGQYNIPDKFDSSYNIIGKGNGIPDIIDEAIWGTLAWEYLQNEDGSIHWGTETKGYPDPFAAPMDLDKKKYGTVIIDNRAAAIGAGLFMHLARLVKPYDSTYSKKLVARAEKSFKYVEANMAKPEMLYYYIQKYLLDGDEAAHEQVKVLKTSANRYDGSVYECGYSLNDTKLDNPAYFISYLVEKNRPLDTAVVNSFKAVLKSAADSRLAEREMYAYPVGNDPTTGGWGHNVAQPAYACAPLLQWRFSNEQKYIDGACDLMNYILGINPLGISYVTGLGMHQVHNPHDRECSYTIEQDWGPKPGITIFGPGITNGGKAATTFPVISTLPFERRFADYIETYSLTEFTIFQTMPFNALYTVLSNGGTWDEKDDPFANPQSGIKGKKLSHSQSSPKFTANLKGNVLKFNVSVKDQRIVRGAIYSLNGKKIMNIAFTPMMAGTQTITIPLQGSMSRKLSNGLLISKLTIDNQTLVSPLINQTK